MVTIMGGFMWFCYHLGVVKPVEDEQERIQYLDVPTIEVERFSSMAGLSRNLPKIHEAFKVELIKLEECA